MFKLIKQIEYNPKNAQLYHSFIHSPKKCSDTTNSIPTIWSPTIQVCLRKKVLQWHPMAYPTFSIAYFQTQFFVKHIKLNHSARDLGKLEENSVIFHENLNCLAIKGDDFPEVNP